MKRFATLLASFVLYLPTITRIVERIIGWAGLSGDLQTWWSLWAAITADVSMLEVICLIIATPLLAVSIFGDPRKWFPAMKQGDANPALVQAEPIVRQPKQRLTQRDIERKLEVIDNLLDIIGFDRPHHSALQHMLKLRGPWEQKLDAGEIDEYLPQLHGARDAILDALRNVERVAKSAERYPDIQTFARELANQDATYPISEFIDNLKRLDKDTPPKTRQLFTPYDASCRKAIIEMEQAREAATKTLLAMRQELSQ